MAKWWTTKAKWAAVLIAMITVYIFAFNQGSDTATITLNNKAVSTKGIDREIRSINRDYEDAANDLAGLQSEISRLEREEERVAKRVEDNNELLDKLNDYEDTEAGLKTSIAEMESELAQRDELKAELAQLSEGIAKKEGEPKVLSAGQYVIGVDLEPGRYVAEANGGYGNFFVRNLDGRSNVAVTLGDRGSAEKEYIFYAESGHTMELDTATKFTEIE